MMNSPRSVRAYVLLWDALRLRNQGLDGERARQRYRAGDRPSEQVVDALVRELADALCEERTLGVALDPTLAGPISAALSRLFAWIDVASTETLLEAYVDDVGFRLAGWSLLLGRPLPPQAPAWVHGERDTFLKELLAQRGISVPQLHQQVAGSQSAPSRRVIDGLLAGGEPSGDELIASFLRMLPRDPGRSFDAELGIMRAHFAVRCACDGLAAEVGRDVLVQRASRALRLARWVACIYESAHQQPNLVGSLSPRESYEELLARGAWIKRPIWFRGLAAKVPDEEMSDHLVALYDRHFYPPYLGEKRHEIAMIERELGVSAGTSAAWALASLSEPKGSTAPDETLQRDEDAARVLGAAAQLKAGRVQEAIADLEAVLANASTAVRAAAHELLAVAHEGLGEKRKARQSAAAAARLGRPLVRKLFEHADAVTKAERTMKEWLVEHLDDGAAWLCGPAWDAAAARSEYATEVAAARQALNEVFPWSWLVEHEIERGPHPVVRQYLFKPGVEALLSVGVMLARAPHVAHAVCGRLRSAAGYADCVAELRVGLLMSEAGAKVQFERNGREAKGPDWHAVWGDVEVALEVKHPDFSEWAKKISEVETAMMFALQRHFVAPLPTVAAFLNFRMSPVLLEALTRNPKPDLEAIDRVAHAASEALVERLPRPTAAALIAVDDFGTFEIELGATGEPRYYWSGYGLSPNDEYEGKRLARILQKAAKQLEHEQGLRIAVLHIGRNALVMNHGLRIARTLQTERWGRSIDAVLLFDAFDANFERRKYLIPGPEPRAGLQQFAAHLSAVKRAP